MRSLICLFFVLPTAAFATAGSTSSPVECAPFLWINPSTPPVELPGVVLDIVRTSVGVEELPDRQIRERLAAIRAGFGALGEQGENAWTVEVEAMATLALGRLYAPPTSVSFAKAYSAIGRRFPVVRGRGIELGDVGPAVASELPRVAYLPTALADLPAGAFDLIVLNDWPDPSGHALEAAVAATSATGHVVFSATGPAAAVRLAHVVELSRARGYTFEIIDEGVVALRRGEAVGVNKGTGTY